MANMTTNDETQGNFWSDLYNRTNQVTKVLQGIMHQDKDLILLNNILFWTSAILGLLGNVLLLTLILLHRKTLLKIPINMLLLSLTVVDLMFLSSNITLVIIFENNEEEILSAYQNSTVLSEIFKSLQISMFLVDRVMSMLTVTALAVIHFISVFYPHKLKKWVTKRRTIYIICATWLCGACLQIPILAIPNLTWRIPESYDMDRVKTSFLFIMFTSVIGGFMPFFIVFVLYVSILFRLCLYKSPTRETDTRKLARASIRHVLQMVVTMFVYLGMFVVVQSMWLILLFTDALQQEPVPEYATNLLKIVFVFVEPSIMLHAVFNPLLQALTTKNYKKLYTKTLCCRKEDKQKQSITRSVLDQMQ